MGWVQFLVCSVGKSGICSYVYLCEGKSVNPDT
jgi:hypothetical protein